MMCSQRPHVLRGGQSQETHKGGRGQVREEAWVTGRVQDRLAPEPPHRSSARCPWESTSLVPEGQS